MFSLGYHCASVWWSDDSPPFFFDPSPFRVPPAPYGEEVPSLHLPQLCLLPFVLQFFGPNTPDEELRSTGLAYLGGRLAL